MSDMTNAASNPDLPEQLFLAIDHVGVAVPDLDEAIAFYRDALGLEVDELPADFVERVTRLVAEDRRSEAVEVFMVEAVGVPAEYIEPMKADPSWTTMAAYAHTLPYDGRIVEGRSVGGRASRMTSSATSRPSGPAISVAHSREI